MSEKKKRLLVLCADIDDDVGQKLGRKTPIVGEKALLDVAVEYALEDPEDPDANAMFAAIREYRKLKREGVDAEVALVAGSSEGGATANIKVVKEVEQLISENEYDGIILVSDGPTDEFVVYLLKDKITVHAVKPVIVQQSREMEEVFLIFVRYLKKLFTEEQYRKYTLGIPGALIVLHTLLAIIAPAYVWQILMFLAGALLLVKGYSLDVAVISAYRHRSFTFITGLLAVLIGILALLGGLQSVANLTGLSSTEYIGYFLLGTLSERMYIADLIVLTVTLPLIGNMLDSIMQGEEIRAMEVGTLFFVFVFRQVLLEWGRVMIGKGDITNLIFWMITCFIAPASIAVLVRAVKKWMAHREEA